ncbi:MAG: methyltransferase family protein [Candidatus Hodarchaeales archaeon]|jgi:protein-S-isoprenylcysteine O-methyltransferase Ste14
MKSTELIQILLRFAFIYILFFILLFFPAGKLDWFEAWLFLAILLGYSIFASAYFIIKSPETLKSRASFTPKTTTDKILVFGFLILFILYMMTPGYDIFQLKFSSVPDIVKATAFLIFILVMIFLFLVIRENAFASRVVEVQEGQKVISTGPYKYVRHPMYTGMILFLFCMPLMLGSYLALIFSIIFSIGFFFRIFDEEKVLEKELAGYQEYKQKVKYRLIPKIY